MRTASCAYIHTYIVTAGISLASVLNKSKLEAIYSGSVLCMSHVCKRQLILYFTYHFQHVKMGYDRNPHTIKACTLSFSKHI